MSGKVMFTITKKPKTPNMVWDAENGKPLCKFVKGVIETNDADLAGKLKVLGYTVSEVADKEEIQTEETQSEAETATTVSKKSRK